MMTWQKYVLDEDQAFTWPQLYIIATARGDIRHNLYNKAF